MECFSQLYRAAIQTFGDTHRFYQVIVRDLRKQMMNHMCSNIMVNVINPSIVTIKCCKPSPQITPFLSTQEGKFKIFTSKQCQRFKPEKVTVGGISPSVLMPKHNDYSW